MGGVVARMAVLPPLPILATNIASRARGAVSVGTTHYTRTHVRGYTVRRRHVPGGPGGRPARTTGDMATANGIASNMCSSLVGGTDRIGAASPGGDIGCQDRQWRQDRHARHDTAHGRRSSSCPPTGAAPRSASAGTPRRAELLRRAAARRGGAPHAIRTARAIRTTSTIRTRELRRAQQHRGEPVEHSYVVNRGGNRLGRAVGDATHG